MWDNQVVILVCNDRLASDLIRERVEDQLAGKIEIFEADSASHLMTYLKHLPDDKACLIRSIVIADPLTLYSKIRPDQVEEQNLIRAGYPKNFFEAAPWLARKLQTKEFGRKAPSIAVMTLTAEDNPSRFNGVDVIEIESEYAPVVDLIAASVMPERGMRNAAGVGLNK